MGRSLLPFRTPVAARALLAITVVGVATAIAIRLLAPTATAPLVVSTFAAALLSILVVRPHRAELGWAMSGAIVSPPLLAATLLAAVDPGAQRLGLAVLAGAWLLLPIAVWRPRLARLSRGHAVTLLDSVGTLIVLIAIGLLTSSLLGEPMRSTWGVIYLVSAAGAVSLMLVVLLSCAHASTRVSTRDALSALALGLLAVALATAIISWREPWLLTFVAFHLAITPAAAAVLADPSRRGTTRIGGWWEWLLPSVWIMGAGGILISTRWIDVPDGAVLAASAVLAILIVRMALTVRDIRHVLQHGQIAMTDEMTGLPNRRALFLDLDRIARPDQDGRHHLVLIGVNGFRELNDTLGHRAGDELLTAIARRLEEATASAGAASPTVRIGGDEFGILIDDEHDADAMAETMIGVLAEPFDVDAVRVAVQASAGIATFPDDTRDPVELLRRADVAMNDAKRRKVGVAHYSPSRDVNSVDHLALADDLRMALETGEGGLWIAYQPQIEAATGGCVGVESLIRWQHPDRGLISPAELLPVAERSGQMTALTDWILDQAIAELARLQRDCAVAPRFAVNVSAVTLVDVGLPDRIAATLECHGVGADQLVIEVTEDAVMSDQRRCLEVLDRISELGVEIAIDDFGTGMSSLSQLRFLPAAELKVDRSFVQGMTADRLDAEIVRLVVAMGRQIGMRVVAEGVENDIERRLLTDLGCHVLQGFGLGRPMPVESLHEWLIGRGELSGMLPYRPARPPVATASDDANAA